ncbi:MAG: tetratricopeptide repeat protein, partial [Flavobacteriales bacterium]|nr:tetratricopeptide repeat protein [Flavobacteriales bacterium]
MNPGRIIWPLMCLVALSTAAQDASTVPEYMKDLESAKTDHARATALFQLAFNISHENTNQGIKWGYEGLGYARLAGDLKLQGDCHNSIGYCFDTSGQPDSALYHYQRSIEFLNSSGNQCATASVFANIGSMHKRRNDLVSALSSFLKALEIQQGGCEDLGYHGSTYYSIGTCYNAMDNYESALKYFEEAAKIEFARGNHAKMGMVHNGMANAYKGLGQWQKAADEFTMAIADYTISNNEYSLAYAYEGKAELFAEQNQLDSAIFYCSQARAIFLAQKVNFDIVYETTLLASYLERKGDKAGAEKLLLEALPISEAEGLDQDRQGIMASLARIAREKGNFELAYKYLSMSTQLRDSLKMDEQKAELAELAAKYETEKRDKLLAIKESENEKQRQQKYFFLAGAVLFLLLALVLVTRYRQKQRMTKTLQEKNVAIEKAKKRAEESEAVKQQFLANMSHEIRTPMNAVVGLSRLLLDKPHDSETREYLEAIHHSGNNLLVILNDILDLSKLEAGKFTIHNISFNLSGELEVLKRVFGPKAEAKGIAFTMHIDQKIPSWISGDPARLLQVLNNLVSNAIKFTSSGSVTLAVLQRNDKIEFEVRDTGMG